MYQFQVNEVNCIVSFYLRQISFSSRIGTMENDRNRIMTPLVKIEFERRL